MPCRLEQVERQAAVHAATEQHRDLQRGSTGLTPAGHGCEQRMLSSMPQMRLHAAG